MSDALPANAGSPFPVEHLPYGVFSRPDEGPRIGVAIGTNVLDLAPLAASEGADFASVFDAPSLNPLMGLGSEAWHAVRSWITARLTGPAYRDLVAPALVPMDQVRLHLPFEVADYVDFYASQDHATNLGRILRPGEPALQPNWRHLPVGYHGRAGTVVVSGTPVVRPTGQRRPTAEDEPPGYGPSERLDIEAEVGFVVGTPTRQGETVGVDDFAEHVFGVVLLNDWTARDIQAWEQRPLGPFLGKSFATSIGAWVTPLAALDSARIVPLTQRPTPLPYLQGTSASGLERFGPSSYGFDLALEVRLNGHLISSPPYRSMYWTPAQMLAHLTSGGASLRTGDLFASGTVSGDSPDTVGSLIELTDNGRRPFTLQDGTIRTFLEDGDEVVLTATAPGRDGVRLGLAEVRGTVTTGRGPWATTRPDPA